MRAAAVRRSDVDPVLGRFFVTLVGGESDQGAVRGPGGGVERRGDDALGRPHAGPQEPSLLAG